jgi:hypothetical protein
MTFYCETTHTAAKRHDCDACPAPIEPGQRYTKWAGITDGDFSACKLHVECRAAEVALNRAHGTDWDEWITLDDMEREDRTWLREEFPVVAARFGWSVYDWREPRVSPGAFFGNGSHYRWQTPD